MAYEPNPFVVNARVSTVTTIGLLHCFCSGAPVDWTAKYTKLAKRTVRAFYLGFRTYLRAPEFNIWHSLHIIDPTSVDKPRPRDSFYRRAAKCYFNDTCRRNFELGNRSTRLCRSCIFRKVHDRSEEDSAAVYAQIGAMDAAHEFYAGIGIRENSRFWEYTMYDQMLHSQIIVTAYRNSTILSDGLIDNEEDEHLSGGRLMKTLEQRLLWFPLEDRFD